MKKAFVKGLSALLLLVAIIGCDDLNTLTTEEADKTALKTAIDSANAAKSGVVASVDGTEVSTTVYWVTAGQLNTFSTAISAAQTVYDTTTSDQTTVDTAKSTLESATTVFIGQRNYGSLILPDIYVAGQVGTTIKLWKNNISLYTINDGNYNWVEDLLVSGDDVYLTGSVNDGENNSVAKLWKNSSVFYNNLPGGSSGSVIGINGSDIYVGGFGPVDEYHYTGMVWKNGSSYFSFPTTNILTSSLYDMVVSGGHVYSLGSEVNTSQETWLRIFKDSSATPIYSYTDGDGDGHIGGSAMAVEGTDVYIAGTEKIAADKTVIKIWKNGTELYPYPLTNSYDAYPGAMAVSGTDVYVVGTEIISGNQRAFRIWKNGGVLYTLAVGEYAGYGAVDMTIFNGDIFTVGTDGVSAKVWRNETVVYSQQNVEFRCIIVKGN
jgi:hypothetical protein